MRVELKNLNRSIPNRESCKALGWIDSFIKTITINRLVKMLIFLLRSVNAHHVLRGYSCKCTGVLKFVGFTCEFITRRNLLQSLRTDEIMCLKIEL